MRCIVCNKLTNVCCICGYCQECIKRYGHDECSRIVQQKCGIIVK
jgi:hypothetical protein